MQNTDNKATVIICSVTIMFMYAGVKSYTCTHKEVEILPNYCSNAWVNDVPLVYNLVPFGRSANNCIYSICARHGLMWFWWYNHMIVFDIACNIIIYAVHISYDYMRSIFSWQFL